MGLCGRTAWVRLAVEMAVGMAGRMFLGSVFLGSAKGGSFLKNRMGSGPGWLAWSAGLTGLLGPAGHAPAQSTPGYLPLTPPPQDSGLAFLGSDSLHWWPRLSTAVVYDDNVLLLGKRHLADTIGLVSPGLTLVAGETTDVLSGSTAVSSPGVTSLTAGGGTGAGGGINSGRRGLSSGSRGLSVDYSAGLSFYASQTGLNAVEHTARVNLALPFSRLTLRLQQDVEVSAETPVDVGQRLAHTTYQTRLDLAYNLSDRTYLQMEGGQTISEVESGIGSRQWSTTVSANYRMSERTTLGAGVSGGLLDVEDGDKQYFEQGRMRLGYEVSERVHLEASAGLEWRQFESGVATGVSPVFDLSGTYAPGEQTRISLSGSRREQSSATLAGQNYTSTSVTASLNQQVAGWLAGVVTLNYANLDYSAAAGGVSSTRTDDTFGVLLGLSMPLTNRLLASGYYQFRKNVSKESNLEYKNNRVGLALTWAY